MMDICLVNIMSCMACQRELIESINLLLPANWHCLCLIPCFQSTPYIGHVSSSRLPPQLLVSSNVVRTYRASSGEAYRKTYSTPAKKTPTAKSTRSPATDASIVGWKNVLRKECLKKVVVVYFASMTVSVLLSYTCATAILHLANSDLCVSDSHTLPPITLWSSETESYHTNPIINPLPSPYSREKRSEEEDCRFIWQ